MQYEKLVQNTVSCSINISNNNVDSLRKSDDLKTVIRVYDGGKIGIAGAVGPCDDNFLLEQAKTKLSQGIPYPCNLVARIHRAEDCSGEIIADGGEVEVCRSLIKRLADSYPGFIFSNKINTQNYTASYTNSLDAQYSYKSNNITLSLTIKAKDSANIMDLGYFAEQTYYSEDKIVRDIGALLNVYNNISEIPEGAPVLIPAEVIEFLIPHMLAEKYVSGSSMLSGKLGFVIFNKNLNISVCRRRDNKQNIPFFDSEGTVLKGDEFPLVKDGVFSGLLTYKRSAANHSLPLSGSAVSDFDSVPSAGEEAIKLMPTCPSLKTLVRGKAIYIAVTSGGDMTPSGDVGLPVLAAFVYEDGKLLGRLPEFSLSANIFDLLGKDLIGVAKNDAFAYADETLIVANCKMNR